MIATEYNPQNTIFYLFHKTSDINTFVMFNIDTDNSHRHRRASNIV